MDRPRSRSKRRVRVVVVLGLLLAPAGGAYLYLFHYRPVGSGPAGPAVGRAAFEAVWTDRRVVLLGLGDSVTAGFGASPGRSYFDRLAETPADDPEDVRGLCLRAVIPNLEVRNLAISGSTSLQHVDRQLPELRAYDSSVFGLVVLTTGGNDIIHSYGRRPPREGAMFGATLAEARPWITAFEKRLELMLDVINACFPGGCAVFIANIYDPTDGVGDIERAGLPAWPDGLAVLSAYNRVIAEAADRRENVHLVDAHAAFLGHGIHCTQFWQAHYRAGDPHYWYYYNLEDPNDRGYDAIRRLFLNKMIEARPFAMK